MIEVIEIRLREVGQRQFYNSRGLKFKIDDTAILEVERGIDFGVIRSNVQIKKEEDVPMPIKSVIRKATEKDLEKIKTSQYKAKEALFVCREMAGKHGLKMKFIRNEYSFDLSQLIFYFTADGRIDFRELVRDLAATFKTRIELRQIGARDETKIFGGIGPCGRGLCCSTFLKEFKPVTIKMARDQNLSPNPSKITGVCGRLMCCLAYENDTYQKFRKELPEIGERLKLGDVTAKVVDLNILKKHVLLSYEDKNSSTGRRVDWVDFSEKPFEVKATH